MTDLLFEIGTEELPAGFILPALEQLQQNFIRKAVEQQLAFGQVKVAGTPRRLALIVQNLEERQPDRREELMGPSTKAGLDADGGFSKAAQGFARSKGAEAAALQIVDTAKGQYLMLVREVVGVQTTELLPDLLRGLLAEFSFAKSMKWGCNTNAFARPVQWLLALYGHEVVDLSLDGIVSSHSSRGHRFMAPDSIRIQGAASYEQQLVDAHVLVDPARRRQAVLEEIERAVAENPGLVDAHVAIDEGLIDTVTNLVECPFGVCGSFDARFLELPEEVLVTSMREHQKYFPVLDGQGRLLPFFVAVNNTRVYDIALTRQGHERVLRARLEDALFFFNADKEKRLEERLADLTGIIFQARLGTMLEKSERLIKLAVMLAEKLAPAYIDATRRAAQLSKIDLLTNMVGEFPSLQGDMGAAYAMSDGEPAEVALAIREHYLPKRAGSELPVSTPGALVALADRLDTLVGCFGIGQQPTGTTDPFGLRRLAIALLHIIGDRGYSLSLREVVYKALALYGDKVDGSAVTVDAVMAFVKGRFVNDIVSRGVDQEAVEAVTSLDFDDVNDCRKKINALAGIRNEEAFAVLAAAFKRIRNIIKGHVGAEVLPAFLEEEAERNLADVYANVSTAVQPLLAQKEYGQALAAMLALKEPVDLFFTSVMVMADDEKIRGNRLNLLTAIAHLFLQIGDISRMTVL
ncbi:MAG: glycine--tRNA ligase subunit beta [Proteobacteria bacterium]|nr:glycine--tRNA ligase subunit beta [Pseudomonadota bacterium]MBU1648791.1 glycine--tRNA ligase subunit beta [Pseudomonadota bacterium]